MPIALSSSRGRGVLAATVLGSGVAFLDTTVVNVALPTLQRELHTSMSGLQWTIDAYLLTLSALLLVGGALGDRYGRRKLYAIGLVVFALASASCGLAPTIEVLIVSRLVQGVGGAMLVPGSLSLLRGVLRDEDVGRAIGLWSGLSAVTTALGPMAGGWLIDTVSWRAAFLINLPLIALALWTLLHFSPESRDEEAPPTPDGWGGLLATVGLSGSVYALIEGPARGWGGWTLLAGGLGVLALAAFLWVEAHVEHPMFPLRLLRALQFTGANSATLAVYFALNGALFFVVQQLQRVSGYSATWAGASMLPMTVILAVFSPRVGRLVAKTGHRIWMTMGPIIAAVGLALFTRVGANGSYWTEVLPAVCVLGFGMAATVAPLTDAALTGAPQRLAGMASGVNNAVARLAALLAVALLPWAAGLSGGAQGEAPAAFNAGFSRAMWISAVAAVVGGLISFATIDRARSADQ